MRIVLNFDFVGWADRVAISTSGICALHCLALPVILSVFPAIGGFFIGEEAFHIWLIWAVVPLSFLSLLVGCRRHKSAMVIFSGLSGVGILILSALLGHEIMGELSERFSTVAGAAILASAHMQNFSLCRQANCEN
tara:strand:- start:105 stop:512 length:408 start_codon:yes stop_codon:yes gene_type:complete